MPSLLPVTTRLHPGYDLPTWVTSGLLSFTIHVAHPRVFLQILRAIQIDATNPGHLERKLYPPLATYRMRLTYPHFYRVITVFRGYHLGVFGEDFSYHSTYWECSGCVAYI